MNASNSADYESGKCSWGKEEPAGLLEGASDLEDLSLWGQSSLPGDQPLSPKGWPLPTLPTPLPVPGEGHIPESLNPHKERKWI